jgi:Flp pilus assembly protein TadG
MMVEFLAQWLQVARSRAQSAIGDRLGGALIEFAVAMPVFVMLLFGIFEFGRTLWIQNALHYSVQQAARCATVNVTLCGDGTNATEGQVQSYAAGLAGAGIPTSAFCLNSGCTSPFPTAPAACSGFNFVSATYALNLNIPYMSLNPTLTAQACFPK